MLANFERNGCNKAQFTECLSPINKKYSSIQPYFGRIIFALHKLWNLYVLKYFM